MRKIIFSVLITMTVLAVSMPSIAQTATVNGIIYRYDTASLTATLIDGKSCSGAVDIPVEINVTYKDSQNRPCASKFSVLYIGDSAFDGCTALTSVTIPASVRSIGAFAFHGCTGLTSIVTGISVSSIGDSAFRGCTGLTSITFEERVATIGSQAFYGCAGLTAVDIPETVTSIGASAFEACENLKRVNISDLTAWCNIDMGESVFPDYSLYLGNTLLSYMDIPDGVTAIKEYAFYRCTGLISVTMPKSVTSVGNFAFAYCKNLKISVSDLTAWCNIDFGYFAFPDYILYLGHDQITDLIIPDGVTAIKQNTFYNCTGITSVTLHNSVAKIGESAFQGCTGLTSMTIPESVKAIGNSAFEGCENLTKVHISDLKAWCNIDFGYSVFPDYSLYLGNTLVTDPVIPDGLTEIKKYVFSHCTSIASVKIPETVTSISSEPFYRCTGLKEVTIPNSVTSIGWGAFSGCDNLKNVYSLNPTPPTIVSNTFSSYAATLHVPAGSSGVYKSHEYWKNFSNIEEAQASIDNVVADNGEMLPAEYYNLGGIRVLTVPAGETPAGLAEGIYIVRRGSRTEKVVVR